MEFQRGVIEGIIWRALRTFHDHRGWLAELFRHDELPAEFHPVMAYVSMTEPGVARTPCARRSGRLLLLHRAVQLQDLLVGQSAHVADVRQSARPRSSASITRWPLVVPPGVVHAYENVGGTPGWVFNCPNRLFKGTGRKEPVDEIRHEDDPNSPFRLDDAGSVPDR